MIYKSEKVLKTNVQVIHLQTTSPNGHLENIQNRLTISRRTSYDTLYTSKNKGLYDGNILMPYVNMVLFPLQTSFSVKYIFVRENKGKLKFTHIYIYTHNDWWDDINLINQEYYFQFFSFLSYNPCRYTYWNKSYCSIKVCLPWTERYVIRYHKYPSEI